MSKPPKIQENYFGYYDEATQTKPAYDPRKQAPCLICGKVWQDDDVRTLSIMAYDKWRREKSWFYRVHKSCHEAMSDEEKGFFESTMFDFVSGDIKPLQEED